jgi:hypothetical protein
MLHHCSNPRRESRVPQVVNVQKLRQGLKHSGGQRRDARRGAIEMDHEDPGSKPNISSSIRSNIRPKTLNLKPTKRTNLGAPPCKGVPLAGGVGGRLGSFEIGHPGAEWQTWKTAKLNRLQAASSESCYKECTNRLVYPPPGTLASVG